MSSTLKRMRSGKMRSYGLNSQSEIAHEFGSALVEALRTGIDLAQLDRSNAPETRRVVVTWKPRVQAGFVRAIDGLGQAGGGDHR